MVLFQPDIASSAPVNGHNHISNGPPNGTTQSAEVPMDSAEADPPMALFVEHTADIRVLSQIVQISDIDFKSRSFRVHTEMTILPLTTDVTRFHLNLGRCAYLPNEANFEGKICVNGEEASYRRLEPMQDLAMMCPSKCLSDLSQVIYKKLDEIPGELRIDIPIDVLPRIRQSKCVKVDIDVLVKEPKTGVQFNSCEGDINAEKGAHVFTYRTAPTCGTREWVPCLDSPDQLCVWKLDITCDASHCAIASGDLLDVEYTSDMCQKIFHYNQLIPTASSNMGWVVGNFTPHAHQEMAETTSFALPGLLNLVRHTITPLDRILEYYEELLACRYPFSSFKLVFVDKIPDDVIAYSSLSIISINVLYHKKIIDVVQESRHQIALAVSLQFFGCFITAGNWTDWWCVQSLARFLASLYVEKTFGTSEYLYHMKRYLNQVCDYEFQWGKIVLSPDLKTPLKAQLHMDPRQALSSSPIYYDMVAKKGHLVQRMLHKRLGHEPYFQVLHKMLTVGVQMAERRDRPAAWTHLIATTVGFFRTVTSVTGQDIPTLLEQWVYNGGHAHFEIQYTFNRKRNMIELEIRQEPSVSNGRQSYVGPLTVWVQELDGSFKHTVQIDADVSRQDLQCHSKGRRQKKKKCPLFTGEEVEIDLSNMDPDSPVLWIRVDADLLLMRSMNLRQPNYQWEYMLKYERDVLSQLQALDRLQQFPSAQSRQILIDTIHNDAIFYRVRCRAAYSLSAVLNRMSETWCGQPTLINTFRNQFGCKSCPTIPKQNNFVITNTTLQQYFLMQTIPQAVARLRTQSQGCLSEVFSFLMSLVKFNDNSVNRYSDDHYRAALLNALSSIVVPGESLGDNLRPDGMNADAKAILEELSYALNMDTVKPSYGRVVGVNALNGIYQLQKHGHLPPDSEVFWVFATPGQCIQMRKAALWILVDNLSTSKDKSVKNDLDKLVAMSLEDEEPAVRIHIPTLLVATPPFTTNNNTDFSLQNPINTAHFAELLWKVITDEDTEARIRQLYSDLYFTCYGFAVPPSLRPPGSLPGQQRVGHQRIFASSSITQPRVHWHAMDDQPSSPGGNVKIRPVDISDDLLA